MTPTLTILEGDCRKMLRGIPDESVQCCVTSPPYFGLRDYKVAGQMGLEATPAEYVANLVAVFNEVRRVLKPDGVAWLNLGDSYAGSWGAQSRGDAEIAEASLISHGQIRAHPKGTNVGSLSNTPGSKAKDLIGIPWRVAFALQAEGWWLRSDIIWAKPNCMPESVTDRPTRSHEYIFLLTKSARYFYDADAIAEPCTEGTMARVSQPGYELQIGSERANAGSKTNGPMKAVVAHGSVAARKARANPNSKSFPADGRNGIRPEKQRGHSRRHDGFNDRWDNMEREEQCTGMRNKRDVWTVPPAQFREAHFATFPEDLIRPCILAGTRAGDTVLDPFFGSGTTGKVSLENGRSCIGVELNPDYVKLARQRCAVTPGLELLTP